MQHYVMLRETQGHWKNECGGKETAMEDLLINAGFTWVLSTIKDPNNRAKYKAVILKVFKVIWTLFGTDPEFQAVVGK
ncbi:MAG: hypothetical protein WD906_03495 [Anaerolineales bacterium]